MPTVKSMGERIPFQEVYKFRKHLRKNKPKNRPLRFMSHSEFIVKHLIPHGITRKQASENIKEWARNLEKRKHVPKKRQRS